MTRTIEYHGISKDEAVAKLNDKGYRAIYEKGVVRIGLDQADWKKNVREVESFLREINYHMSYGFFNVSRVFSRNKSRERDERGRSSIVVNGKEPAILQALSEKEIEI